MRDSKNIDELFSSAANEPVLTSFDETKLAFLNSVSGSSSGSSTGGGSFFTKNWIIMLSIIATGTLATILFFPSTENDVKPTPPEKKNTITATETSPETESDSTIKVTLISPNNEVIQMPGYLIPIALRNDFNNTLQPVRRFVPAPTRKDKVAPYRFPNLTEDEKRENEKRKKAMVKDFVKINKRAYSYVPSASIKIDTKVVSIQSFVIQKHEVTNIQYKTFLFDLLINGKKEEFLKAKPDQNKWVEMYGDGMKTMTENYFSHEAYANFPVVNVSREAANMYCVWLTKEIHKYTDKKGDIPFNDLRLPQREEWIYAARGTEDSRVYPWAGDSVKNQFGEYLANYKPLPDNFHVDGGFHTVDVDSYNPNDFGLYCISGNAAEMVNESNLSKDLPTKNDKVGTAGGSWASSAEELKVVGDDPYKGITEAHPEIGFRIVSTYLSRATTR